MSPTTACEPRRRRRWRGTSGMSMTVLPAWMRRQVLCNVKTTSDLRHTEGVRMHCRCPIRRSYNFLLLTTRVPLRAVTGPPEDLMSSAGTKPGLEPEAGSATPVAKPEDQLFAQEAELEKSGVSFRLIAIIAIIVAIGVGIGYFFVHAQRDLT